MKDQNSDIRLMMNGATDAMGAGFARLVIVGLSVVYLVLFGLVIHSGNRLLFNFGNEPSWLAVILDAILLTGALVIGAIPFVKGRGLPAALKQRGIEAQARKERAESTEAAERHWAARGSRRGPRRNAE